MFIFGDCELALSHSFVPDAGKLCLSQTTGYEVGKAHQRNSASDHPRLDMLHSGYRTYPSVYLASLPLR